MQNRKASWSCVDDNWFVYFSDLGVDIDGYYSTNDFQDVQDVVDAWVNFGILTLSYQSWENTKKEG
jgi:hypothetical protein